MTMRRRSKSFSVIVRGGAGLLFGALLVIGPFREASSASFISNLSELSQQESQAVTETLAPNKPLERKLRGGEGHLYEITLPAKHFLRLTLDQLGIDVALTLFDQQGGKIIQSDQRHGERGQEGVSLMREVGGVYRLEVRSIRKTDLAGSYQLTLALPPLTEFDQTSNQAEQLVADARTLLARPTRDSATSAIAKCQEAKALVELTNNLQMQAVVLNLIGRGHYVLGEHKRSLEFHKQALALTRASVDQYEEAETLADLSETYRAQSENQQALDYANQALSRWQLLRDRRREWEALITAGRICYALADQHQALFYYEQALKVSRSLADANLELSTLGATALSYYVLGENEEAAELWKQALALAIKTGNRGMETSVLGKLGAVYGALSDQQTASPT